MAEIARNRLNGNFKASENSEKKEEGNWQKREEGNNNEKGNKNKKNQDSSNNLMLRCWYLESTMDKTKIQQKNIR